MGVKPHLLLSLGGHSKQGGDERDLPQFDGLRKLSGGFEFRHGLGIGCVLINIDDPGIRRDGVGHRCGLGYLFLERMGLRS